MLSFGYLFSTGLVPVWYLKITEMILKVYLNHNKHEGQFFDIKMYALNLIPKK